MVCGAIGVAGAGSPFHCASCEAVLPPDRSRGHFELLGMPADCFDVDGAVLHERYRELQRQLHPDRFQLKSAAEQDAASEQSAHVNEAYNILKEP